MGDVGSKKRRSEENGRHTSKLQVQRIHQVTLTRYFILEKGNLIDSEQRDFNMAATHQLRVQDIFSVKDYVCLVTGGMILVLRPTVSNS